MALLFICGLFNNVFSSSCCPQHSVLLPTETRKMRKHFLTPSLIKPRQDTTASVKNLLAVYLRTHTLHY